MTAFRFLHLQFLPATPDAATEAEAPRTVLGVNFERQARPRRLCRSPRPSGHCCPTKPRYGIADGSSDSADKRSMSLSSAGFCSSIDLVRCRLKLGAR